MFVHTNIFSSKNLETNTLKHELLGNWITHWVEYYTAIKIIQPWQMLCLRYNAKGEKSRIQNWTGAWKELCQSKAKFQNNKMTIKTESYGQALLFIAHEIIHVVYETI